MYARVMGMMGLRMGLHDYAEYKLACVKIVSVEVFTYKHGVDKSLTVLLNTG